MPIEIAFIHGGGQGGWVWDAAIDALRQQCAGDSVTALALDMPGCGAKRERDTGAMSFDDIAEEAIRDIETAGLLRPMLVGHSQGGQIMSAMLAGRPELFSRAVYVACSILLPGQTVLEMMGNSLQGTKPDEVGWPFDPTRESIGERYPSMFCNDMVQDQREAFLAKLGADNWPASTYGYDMWRHEHHGDVPATYVLCLRDAILPVAWQETFAGRFGAERIVRVDAGHQAMVTRPHCLAEILRLENG